MHSSWSSCLIVHLQITNLTFQIFIPPDFNSIADENSRLGLEDSPTKILLNDHALVIEDEDVRSNYRDHEDTSKVRRRSSSLDDRFNGR